VQITILDMPPIFAQVHSNSLGAREFSQGRGRYWIWFCRSARFP
jgi:hypothetical protein